MSDNKGMSLEEFGNAKYMAQPLKVKAIRNGIIYSKAGQKEYKTGQVYNVYLVGSMVFFTPHGETINFYDFELVN